MTTDYEDQIDPELLARAKAHQERRRRANEIPGVDDVEPTESAGTVFGTDAVSEGRSATMERATTDRDYDGPEEFRMRPDGHVRSGDWERFDRKQRSGEAGTDPDDWNENESDQAREARLRRQASSRGTHPADYSLTKHLDEEHQIVADFLSTGGWHVPWKTPTGFPAGRPATYTDGVIPPEVIAAVIDEVGFEPDEFAALTRKGGKPRTDEQRARRAELARSVAKVARRHRGRAIEVVLIAAYGCSRSTITRLVREGRG